MWLSGFKIGVQGLGLGFRVQSFGPGVQVSKFRGWDSEYALGSIVKGIKLTFMVEG